MVIDKIRSCAWRDGVWWKSADNALKNGVNSELVGSVRLVGVMAHTHSINGAICVDLYDRVVK